MLFLGITTPKKEIFLGQYADLLGVPVLHGVGGSFDVFAGITRRAPASWQRLGLEWAYRLVQEPRRLWRRYLVTNTTFLLLLVRELVRPRRPYPRRPHPIPAVPHPRGPHHEDMPWMHPSPDA
jgi:N-acetylglucosaminyldiphosphoundecaprenol N-acetyl-beta-D-mannosaminyltransferase